MQTVSRVASAWCFRTPFAMFYIPPARAGSADAIGMVYMIILATLVLSLIIGVISKNKVKYLYPAVTAICFLPSVFLYYNTSALIHSVWYFVVASIGVLLGTMVQKLILRCKLPSRHKQ